MRRIPQIALPLLLPCTALADTVAHADITSGTPCEATEAKRFKAHVFSKALAPESLWHLISNVLCPNEGSSASVKQHLPDSVHYIDEIFDTDGKLIRDRRTVSAAEAASIVTASSETTYGELTIEQRRRARLQLNNFVCAVDVHAEVKNGRWLAREIATQCE
ncbi:hypothetical protein L3D22_10090 [Lysobacter soli]|uniref:hypothetical protein n=1 Tax=Lysobacter soli TaxID=453783 RepID=UPI0020A0F86B|nr:hypothetical protein [Lysobacter soli]UTA52746.1 hypothetical protein L3D22_10090 [Lysobacter soli]